MGKLRSYIGDKHYKSVDDLSTDELVLFNFLALIADIKYRVKYGHSLEWTNGKGYSKHMQNEDVPGQIPSVEDGLERVVQRRLPDAS